MNCPAAQAAVGQNYIEQWGITWTFDKPITDDKNDPDVLSGNKYLWGKFVNDDYWVKGPVKIISISPPSQDIAGRIKNGSMINPAIGNVIGYDNQSLDDTYSAALNVAFNVSNINPLDVPINSSLVSTISIDQPFKRPQLDSAAILTVLSNAAPKGSFRPPYCGTDKNIQFNKSDLNYNKLKKLPKVTFTPSLTEPYGIDAPSGAAYQTPNQWFQRPWLDHGTDNPGRAIRPVNNCPQYGREISRYVNWAGLLLNLDFSDSEKEPLLIGMVQYGLDLYRIVSLNPTSFNSNGTITSGRLLPILIAGVVLDDAPGAEAIRNIGQKTGQYRYTNGYSSGNLPPDYVHFLETDQTHYVTQRDIDVTNNLIPGVVWNPDDRDYADVPYTQNDLGFPEWGIRNEREPQKNNNIWDTAYRSSSSASIVGTALVAQIMGIKDLFNQPAMFDYADRYVGYLFPAGSSGYDVWWNSTGQYITVALPRYAPQPPAPLQFGVNGFEVYKNAPFVLNMWDTYRANYGPIWPEKAVIVYGDVSGDSALSAYDAALAARIAVGLDAYPMGDNLTKADVSGDGSVTAYDAALIAQRAVGLISKFPVES